MMYWFIDQFIVKLITTWLSNESIDEFELSIDPYGHYLRIPNTNQLINQLWSITLTIDYMNI